jgi:hypothetical protein
MARTPIDRNKLRAAIRVRHAIVISHSTAS